jgi:hypothetical protein
MAHVLQAAVKAATQAWLACAADSYHKNAHMLPHRTEIHTNEGTAACPTRLLDTSMPWSIMHATHKPPTCTALEDKSPSETHPGVKHKQLASQTA